MDEREIDRGAGPEAAGPASAGPSGAGSEARADDRPGPTWRGWVISILVAVVLSVAATVIFGGPSARRAAVAGRPGACGGECCPPGGR